MMGYGAVSLAIKPQPMLDRARAGKPEDVQKVAKLVLPTINLSYLDEFDVHTLDAAAPERVQGHARGRYRIRYRTADNRTA